MKRKKKAFEFHLADLPEKGTASIIGSVVICNDNGILKVYK